MVVSLVHSTSYCFPSSNVHLSIDDTYVCLGIRNYQIVDKSERTEDIGLVEIGPRMVLIPIRIFSGSLGGATLFLNPTFISPNEQRSQAKKYKG